MTTQEKKPQAVDATGSQEIKPATASDLGTKFNTDWREWLQLPERGWITDGGEEVWGVA